MVYESVDKTFSPDTYVTGKPVEVSITIEPVALTQSYTIEDTPPPSWTIKSNFINEGGVWDNVNKKVKWGPFSDDQTRTFTYEATPPISESGTKTFNGVDAIGMDYGKLTPLLVEAVKDLKSEVDQLRQQNKDKDAAIKMLEDTNRNLQNRLAKVEKLIVQSEPKPIGGIK